MPTTAYHVRATLIPDGRGQTDIWIADGRFTFAPVPGAIDLPGRFAAPGMVDGHVHLSLDFACTGLPPASPELVLHNARRHLRTGVTALRDAGYVQQLALDGVTLPLVPVIFRSGWIHVPENRFFPGVDIGKATAPGELLARFREVAGHGVTWFKVIADFPGPDMNLFAAPLTYPIEILRQLVAAAHAAGVRVLAHSTGADVAAIVETGVDSIEHGMSVTPDVVRRMAAIGTQWCPTIATAETFLKAAEARGVSSAPRLAYSARTRSALELAAALGVDVLAGSDELPHGALDREIDALARHGLSVRQALAAATTVGRRALGLRGVEEGAPADLVIWDADPRDDVSCVTRPRTVLGNGVPVDLAETYVPAAVAQSLRERMGDRSFAALADDQSCVFARDGDHGHG